MYSIVFDFINLYLFGGVESALVPILTDITMILFYVALVNLVIWVFSVASRVIRI